jgi:hypothetical protein
MTRAMIRGLWLMTLGFGLIYSACGTTAVGEDCRVKCQDVDNTCVQTCTDDTCKTKCTTDLDNCSVSCDKVAVTTPDGG